MSSPLSTGPVEVTAMMTRLRNITAAISGGPKPSTMAATGMIITRVKMSLTVSEMAEAKRPISSAWRGCPFFVSPCPSNTVAMEGARARHGDQDGGTLPP